MFVEKRFLFGTTDINKNNIYCDAKCKICNFVNKFLHKTLFPHPSIILIVSPHAKNCGMVRRFSPKYNSIALSRVKESMIFNEEADMYVLALLIT